jgi:hypothetical protein
MKHVIEVPEFDLKSGLPLYWDTGFEITVRVVNEAVVVSANPAGLRSLARHLLLLAQETTPVGQHIHLDDLNSLEDGSSEIVLERT